MWAGSLDTLDWANDSTSGFKYQLVEIRGKKGAQVPILVPKFTNDCSAVVRARRVVNCERPSTDNLSLPWLEMVQGFFPAIGIGCFLTSDVVVLGHEIGGAGYQAIALCLLVWAPEIHREEGQMLLPGIAFGITAVFGIWLMIKFSEKNQWMYLELYCCLA
jgi:hypothetical protein